MRCQRAAVEVAAGSTKSTAGSKESESSSERSLLKETADDDASEWDDRNGRARRERSDCEKERRKCIVDLIYFDLF